MCAKSSRLSARNALQDLKRLPEGHVVVSTYTTTPYFRQISPPEGLETLRSFSGPGIAVPEDWISQKVHPESGRVLRGVYHQVMREADWRIVVGLHPTRPHEPGSPRTGYSLCLRDDRGYWTPQQGVHHWRLAQIRGGRRRLNRHWGEIFTVHAGHLAWPGDRRRPGGQQGWGLLQLGPEQWTLHTSAEGLRDLLAKKYGEGVLRHFHRDYGLRILTFRVPPEDVPLWTPQAQRLSEMLHLQAVNVGPLLEEL